VVFVTDAGVSLSTVHDVADADVSLSPVQR
jgi:hypothetical protein